MEWDLQITTFGGLQMTYAGVPLRGLPSRKAEALLVYLAVGGRARERDRLADLLWDDLPQQRSRGNLSVLLSALRPKLGSLIVADRYNVALQANNYFCDAYTLDQEAQAVMKRVRPGEPLAAADEQRLMGALALYRGEFLHGFSLRDGRGFDGWMRDEQERLRHLAQIGWQALLHTALARSDDQAALTHARAVLNLDPLHEQTHAILMEILARNGRRTEAISHFERYRERLEHEFGLEPTQELYELRAGLDVPARVPVIRAAPTPVPTVFGVRGAPYHASSFIGRERELTRIAELFGSPDCRLLSLVGPGGIGKTRLALASAAIIGPQLAQGAAFIALSPITMPELIPSVVADVLDLRLSEQTPGIVALTTALGEQALLLILDNCEHLIAAVAELAGHILRAAPHVRILVTSRERLGLQGEQILDLEGMRYPDDLRQPVDPSDYSALTLFTRRAQAVQPNFQLSADVLPSVVEICRLVGGLPLGVELAASWVRSLPPRQIVAEIIAGADFLTSRQRDTPQRHRSLRTVFEHSWELLSVDEQEMLSRCAIFRGGFRIDAATAVSIRDQRIPRQRVLHILADLVDKSLLRYDTDGRYSMHELVRQYAYEHLAGDQTNFQVVMRHMIDYFAEWCSEQYRKAAGVERKEALIALGNDIDNIRAAWAYALRKPDVSGLSRMLPGLSAYYDARGQFRPALEQFGQAIGVLSACGDDAHLLIAAIQSQCGHCADRLGDYQQADTFLHAALPVARLYRDHALEAAILNLIGRVAEHRGAFDSAIEAYHASIAGYRLIGDRYGEAAALHNLSSVYESKAEYETARSLLEQVLALRRSIGDLRGIAFSLNTLGIVREMQGDDAAAVSLYLESVGVFDALGEAWGMVLPIGNLGDVATTNGEYATAQTYYRRAIELTREHWLLPHMLMNLVKTAQLFARVGRYSVAAELIAIPLIHPATDELFRRAAERLLNELSAVIPSEALAQALAHGRSQSLNTMINKALAASIETEQTNSTARDQDA